MKVCNYVIILLAVIFANVCNGQIAVDDYYSIPLGSQKIVNVLLNDGPSLNSAMYCTEVWGSTSASLQSLPVGPMISYYNSNLSFIGRDTCFYRVHRSEPSLIDTGMVIFDVISDSTLLPVADFDIEYFGCQGISFYNTSINYSSVGKWYLDTRFVYNPTITYNQDTIYYNVDSHYIVPPDGNLYLEGAITLFVSNEFGNAWTTRSYSNKCVVGINDISLSNIFLYPNPTNSYITIDMSNNDNEITRSYAAIEIYNALGQMQKEFMRSGVSNILSLNISEVPQGIYLATIVSINGERRTLGRFTKE